MDLTSYPTCASKPWGIDFTFPPIVKSRLLYPSEKFILFNKTKNSTALGYLVTKEEALNYLKKYALKECEYSLIPLTNQKEITTVSTINFEGLGE